MMGGLLIGGFWYLNRGRPPIEEALRTIVVFAVVMSVIKGRLRRRSVDVHLAPLIATKAVLVLIAAAVGAGLGHSISNPALVVAIGLGVAVCLVGALGDRHFFTQLSPPSPAPVEQRIR